MVRLLSAAMDRDIFGHDYNRTWQMADEDCRYALGRFWDEKGPRACVIGCNPSTATDLKDDPTSLWWNRWFKHWGYGGYIAVNLYPFRTSSPKECRAIVDGITERQDWWARDRLHFDNFNEIVRQAKKASAVFACWGNIAWDRDWIDEVVEAVTMGEEPWPDIMCWGTTKSGAPIHPMARGKHRIDPLTPAQVWATSMAGIHNG